MEQTTFLGEDEVAELTGIKRGRTDTVAGRQIKLTKWDLQCRQLRASGIPFYTNARGRPVVVRSSVDGGSRAAEPPRRWTAEMVGSQA